MTCLFLTVFANWLGLFVTAPTPKSPVLLGTLEHQAGVGAIYFSPDGETLLTVAPAENQVLLWNLKTKKSRTIAGPSNEGRFTSMACSQDCKALAVSWSGEGNAVFVWDMTTGKQRATVHGRTLLAFALSPDGITLVVSEKASPFADTGTVKFYDAPTGKELVVLPDLTVPVTGIAFSPDGKTLTTSTWDKEKKLAETRLWDVKTRKVRTTLKGKIGIMATRFSTDSKSVATVSWNEHDAVGEVKIWDMATGRMNQELENIKNLAYNFTFSPDGRRFALGGGALNLSATPGPNSAMLKVWDVTTGKQQADFKGISNPVYGVAFSPDGRLLVSTGGNPYEKLGEVKIWEVATGKKLTDLTGHTDAVGGSVFSPNGKVLATAGNDGTVRLWDVSDIGRPSPR